MTAAFLGGLLIMIIGMFRATRCLYSDIEFQPIDLLLLCFGAITSLTAFFVRMKIKDGTPIFKLTEKDRKQIQEARVELSPRSILIRLLTYFGALIFLAGCASIFHGFVESNKQGGWSGKMLLTACGGTCLLLAISLSKRK